jgi:hypothetical protein
MTRVNNQSRTILACALVSLIESVVLSAPQTLAATTGTQDDSGAPAFEKSPQPVQQGLVLEIGKLPGIQEQAMIAAGFIPDVRLFPVSGFLHRLAAAWAADIAVVIVFTALSGAARVQHLSAR